MFLVGEAVKPPGKESVFVQWHNIAVEDELPRHLQPRDGRGGRLRSHVPR
jgi:hypothetical protein